MVKRKDSNGRVLEKGESQRKNGTYMYRWTDISKNRRTIYANTLQELREKELEVTRLEKISKISWEDGKMTVETLVSRYKEISNVKITTKQKYKYFETLMEKIGILNVPINKIHTTDAKMYMMKLSDFGYSYGTIQNLKAFLSPAFQLAVEDDYIVKNPFLFKLNKIIEDDRKERTSISVEKEQEYLDYVKNNAYFKKSYPDIVILLKTGMRVSELYGLTFKDIDIKNRRINVNKQLHLINRKYVLIPPKSKAGNRILAMDDDVLQAFITKFMEHRPKVEKIIDGYSGFVFLNRIGNPKTRKNLQVTMISIKESAKRDLGKDFSGITPHVLRHTFCSRMIEKGMDVKTLQLVMGHSDIGTTLNVYTHKTPEDVANKMQEVISESAVNM